MDEALRQQLATLEARVAELERARTSFTTPRPELRPARAATAAAALETTLGTYWLSRIGIVSLITGAALLVITYFGALGVVLRVALGYAMAGALAWLGLRLARRHETFGRIVFGGGLAIGYFVTYALHFVPAMRIVDSELLGLALVALAIAGIVAIAHRMRSETVAGIALYLGLHTGMLSEVTALTLVCTSLLAVGAGFFLAKNRWVLVPLGAVIAVYATHASLALGSVGVSPGVSLAFLCLDFGVFAGAAMIRTDHRPRALLVLALLNWLGAIGLGSHALAAVSRSATFGFLGGFAIAHGLLALIAWRRRAPRAFVGLLLVLALVTLGLALPARLVGGQLVAGWLGLALGAAGIARAARSRAFGWVGFALLVVAQLAVHASQLGAFAQLGWVFAAFAVDRLHAPGDRPAVLRTFLIVLVALGALQLAIVAVPGGLRTLAWIGIAFALFATGFALRDVTYRWTAFGVLALAALRLLAVELHVLSAGQRILTFVIAGVLLLVVSYLYTRARRSPRGS